MANLKAIIYTTTNGENNLEYGIKDIVSLSSMSQVIANEELPNFDYFPNSGTLTVKDNNLVIYNKALNGEFDDFRYKVKYFLNNKPISSHIINERPNYDYESKTCTFYLGNEADYAINQQLPIYAYPLKSQTLYEIFYNLMVKIYNISYEDFNELVSGIYGKSNLGSSIKPLMTFREYFELIEIMFPYMSATSAREALKNVLTIAQCGLFINRENKFKLVRLDGYTNRNNIFENTYLIPPSCISQGFVPSLMLSNKFNEIDIEHKIYDLEHFYDQKYGEYLVSKENAYTYHSTITGHDYDKTVDKTNEDILNAKRKLLVQQVQSVTPRTYHLEINKFIDNGLKSLIKETSDRTRNEPKITFVYKKTDKISSGVFKYTEWKETNTATNSVNNFIYNQQTISTNTETQSDYKTVPYGQSTTHTWTDGTTTTIETFVPENESWDYYYVTSNNKNLNNARIKIIKELNVVTLYGEGYPSLPETTVTIEETTFEFESMKVSIYADYDLIVFSNGTSKFVNSQNVSNQTTISSTSEIVQDTSYFDNQSNNMINAIGNIALSVYDKGLQTGNLTVISHNYNTYYSFLNKQEETFVDFTVLSNSPITKKINKLTNKELPKKVIVTDASNIPKEYDLSSNIWDDGIHKIVYNSNNNELVFSYSGTIFWRIKKVVVKYITIDETPEIGNNSNQRPTFELGDQVIPCKDNKGTPIILQEGIPVVYQVIKEETLQQGGAVFQNLTLREVKPL